ncbi:epithelial sodium channel subunit alpha-like [Antedon mediterranea]|uniref:epithelial sodium channel subunit alpha-like n=1 Tax=Antedon mediterranea TaxID=105859 RepID=UPI003AF704A7
METTTAHGIPQITSAKTKRRKVSWMLLVLFALGMFLYQTQELMVQYFKYDFDTNIEIKYSRKLDFPAVTICNINPIKYDRLQESDATDLREGFDRTYVPPNRTEEDSPAEGPADGPEEGTEEGTEERRKRDTGEQAPSPEQRVWNNWDTLLKNETSFYSLPTKVATEQENLVRIMSDLTTQQRQYLGHQINDLLVNCSWIGYPCSPQNFSRFLNPIYGNCYTLNPLNTSFAGGEYKSSSFPGPSYVSLFAGLTMTLFIELAQYLPQISSSGLRLHIHSQNTMPFPEDEGLYIPPGYRTSVSIRKMITSRIGRPYNTCVKDSDESYHNIYHDLYGMSYSVQACTKSCYQKRVVGQCGCYDSNYPFKGGTQPCRYSDVEQKQCMSKVNDDYKNNVFKCDCPQPCTDDTFKTTQSFTYWPTPEYKVDFMELLSEASPALNDLVRNENFDGTSLRENLLLLDIYFGDLNYDAMEQSPLYSKSDLAGGLGGTVGLWIGVSVLTVFEAIEFLYDAVCLLLKKAGKKQAKSNESNITVMSEVKPTMHAIDRKFGFIGNRHIVPISSPETLSNKEFLFSVPT